MWRWLRVAAGVLILGALVLKVGADPFVDGLRHTTPVAIGAAMAVTLVTTVCCAWRWSRVVGRLGVDLPLWSAVGAYYRSQFVNATLPGGVLGDVHRAVRHGRHAGCLGIGVRGVAWERVIGLVVYIATAIVVVALLPTPLRPAALVLIGVAAVALVVVLVLPRLLPDAVGRSRLARAVSADARTLVGAGVPRGGIVLASLGVAAGHTAVFVVAARSAGVTTPTAELVPLAMVVLVGSTIPLSVAGWGPREATAVGAFATVGLSAEQAVTVAVVYGVLALLATLPGALLLLLPRRAEHRAPRAARVEGTPAAGLGTVTVGGVAHG